MKTMRWHRYPAVPAIMMFLMLTAVAVAQDVPKGTVIGTWELKFDNGVQGKLVVDKNKATIDIPNFFQGEGSTDDRGDYAEFFMTGKNAKELFVWAFIKGGVLEGGVQDKAPCEDLKKALGPAVKVSTTSCRASFKATKK